MRALFLTPQLPYPPAKGTTLRNFNLIKNLAAKHEIHLLTFVDDEDEVERAAPLNSLCQSIYPVPMPAKRSNLQRLSSTLLSTLPDMARRLPSVEFRVKLAVLLETERFDLVQVEGIEMAQYIDDVRVSRRPRPSIVFDEHNAEYLLQRRAFETGLRSSEKLAGTIYSFIQWRKLMAYEASACRKSTAVVAVSEADRRALLSLDPSLKVSVVSNGIDIEFFQSGFAGSHPDAPTLIFVGTMDYRPNVDAMVWFCRDIFPTILQQVPQVRLQIVGRNPTGALQEVAGPNVEVVGEVDDVRPYIYHSAVYVVPMRIGGGVRFKVLEAMVCGVPVVSTKVGAEGIDVKDEEHLLLAETPAEFTAKVVRLLQNREAGSVMAAKARERVMTQYDWRVVVPRLEEVWNKHVGKAYADNQSSL